MFTESFPSPEDTNINRETVVEVMNHEVDVDPDGMDIKFEKLDSESPKAKLLVNTYDGLLANCYEDIKNGKDGTSFVGSGNHAVVLKDPNRNFCMKVMWETLFIKHFPKPGKHELDLPERLQGLERINTYFNGSDKIEGIKQKRRKFIASGIDLKTPNKIETEATITEYVHKRFEKIGMKDFTPKVLSVFRYKNEEDGSTDNLKKYAVEEEIKAIHLGYIDGITVEQLILDQPEEFISKIDTEAFIKELSKIIGLIHSFKVTHGDISIRNIMIDRTTLMPRVIDFGAAQFSRDHLDLDEVRHDMDGIANISSLLRSFKNDPKKTEEAMRNRHSKL